MNPDVPAPNALAATVEVLHAVLAACALLPALIWTTALAVERNRGAIRWALASAVGGACGFAGGGRLVAAPTVSAAAFFTVPLLLAAGLAVAAPLVLRQLSVAARGRRWSMFRIAADGSVADGWNLELFPGRLVLSAPDERLALTPDRLLAVEADRAILRLRVADEDDRGARDLRLGVCGDLRDEEAEALVGALCRRLARWRAGGRARRSASPPP